MIDRSQIQIPVLSPSEPTVFLFHGVTQLRSTGVRNYTGKHIEATIFQNFIRQWSEDGRPCTTEEIVSHRQGEADLPPKSFAVTFDDGFQNNLTTAAPILREFGIPATFFICSGFLDSPRQSWADSIEAATEVTKKSAVSLDFLGINQYPLKSDSDRIRFVTRVRKELKNRVHLDPQQVQRTILAELEVHEPPIHEEFDRKLDAEEVKKLNSDSLFGIGGHTHTHPILSRLSLEAQRRELDFSTEILSSIIETPLRYFAYPEGSASSYDAISMQILEQSNYVAAFTTEDATVRKNAGLFEIPRRQVA